MPGEKGLRSKIMPGHPLTACKPTASPSTGRTGPAQPFEPPSQRFTIVPLAAECVMPAKPVMNIWGTALQDRSLVLLVNSQKVL